MDEVWIANLQTSLMQEVSDSAPSQGLRLPADQEILRW
jgi:hypothetical protein